MNNKRVLSKAVSELSKAKAPAKSKDIITDPMGQWKYPGQVTRIPSNNITMEGVPYPVWAQPNVGPGMMMQPGQDYDFPGADYVDEYPQMQDGGVTTQEEINNANAAMMKARLAYAHMHGNPAAQRMIVAPDQPYQFEDGNTGTHYMASMDNYAVPQIQNVDGQLMLGDYSPESAEAMKFDNPEDAQYFAKNYKTVSPAFIETELTPEEIQEYAKGGYVVEDISIPELQDGGEGAELNLDLPEQTVYANESKRKLQGSLIDKLSQVKNAYQDYRENAGLTKLRLKNEGVSSIESLKRNIKEYKTQLEEEKKSFDRAQKALNVLQKKDPKTWENKKLKDVMSAQGVDALRSLYKDGKISNESFIDFYNNFGKQFDREAVKTSAEDQVKLEDSWYGKKDKQGRRTWMSNPMNVAKIAQGVAIGAPLAPVAAMAAPTIASGASSLIPAAQTALNASMLGVPGLTANNLLWGAGAYLSANEVMDPKSTTRTSINRAIKDPTLSNIGEATGNTAMTALGFAGIPVKAGVASLADDVTQAGRHLTTQTLLKDTYKINPFAENLNNPNSSYRVAGLDAAEDFQKSGVLRSRNTSPPIVHESGFVIPARPTSFPSFQKGYADMAYLPQEGGVVFKTDLPTFKRGDINPVSGKPIKSRHYAHRVIDPKTGNTMTEIPASEIKMFEGKPHWLKGYKEVPKELPGSSNAVSSVDDVGRGVANTPEPWQMQELPGLHLESTMNSPLNKFIKPIEKPLNKEGLISTEQALNLLKSKEGKERYEIVMRGFKEKFGDAIPKKMTEDDFVNFANASFIDEKGMIYVDDILKIIGKESGGTDKVALIRQALGDNIPQKMDYNDFRKTVQDQLIPLEKQFSTRKSDYGIDRLGYNYGTVEENIGGTFNVYGNPTKFKTRKEAEEFLKLNSPIENQTLILGNKNKFGRGSDAHGNPKETLGHAHFLRDAETPDVLTVTQIQSDAFQGTHRIMPKDSKNLTALEKQQNSLARMEELQERNKSILNKMKTEGVDEAGLPVQDYQIRQFEDIVKAQENANIFKKADIENFTQKQLLDKNHQERYLQELVDYAGKRGDVNKMRVPTSETAAKVQGYNPILESTLGPITKKQLDKSSTFEEFFTLKMEEIKEEIGDYELNSEEINTFKKIYNDYKAGKLGKVYDPAHTTILKKYEEQPKIIKKLFGEEPTIVTDSKGNTWYEFDIPDKFKKGKGEIKAFSTLGAIGTAGAVGAVSQYQQGGSIELKLTDNEIEWYKSQGYIVEELN
jgi:hypothetical protein